MVGLARCLAPLKQAQSFWFGLGVLLQEIARIFGAGKYSRTFKRQAGGTVWKSVHGPAARLEAHLARQLEHVPQLLHLNSFFAFVGS